MFQPKLPKEYSNIWKIVTGGQADIYRAIRTNDKGDNVAHAIKVYQSTDPQLQGRGWVEIDILRRLRQNDDDRNVQSIAWPRYVSYHKQELDDGKYGLMLIYEWIEGESLVDFANNQALGILDRLKLAMACCDALAAWHGRNLLHRDIKPSNMIANRTGSGGSGDFVVTIIDAGLALSIGAESEAHPDQTVAGVNMGTSGFRHAKRLDVGAAGASVQDDLFALGVSFYHLFAGLGLVLGRELPSFRSIEDPRERQLVIERCFWKLPTHPSLRQRLAQYLESEPPNKEPPLCFNKDDNLHKDELKRLQGLFGEVLGAVLLKATHEEYGFLYRTPGALRNDLECLYKWAQRSGDLRGELPIGDLSILGKSPAGRIDQFDPTRPWWRGHAAWKHKQYTEAFATYAHLCRGAQALIETGKRASAEAIIECIDPALADTFEVGHLRLAARPYLRALEGHGGEVLSASFNRDGSCIVTACDDGKARVFDADSGGPALLTLEGHGGRVYSASFDRDGSRIVTACQDGKARVFDAKKGGDAMLTLVDHGHEVNSASFNRDGSRIVTACDDGKARVFDAEKGGPTLLTLEGHGGVVLSASFNRDGSRIVTACRDGKARVFDAEKGGPALLTLEGHGDWVRSASFNRDSSRIVTACDDGKARVFDAEKGGPALHTLDDDRSLALFASFNRALFASFNRDGSRIVKVCDDGKARVFDAEKGGPALLTLQGHGGRVFSASFNRDGARIITVCCYGKARIIVAANGGPALLTLEGHGDAVLSASFNRDGSRIVTVCNDGKARVFDAEKGGPALLTLEGHGGGVFSAALNRDGSRIVMTCHDGKARVFDAENGGAALLTLEGHGGRGGVKSASFSPDGSRIVTACIDDKARVFDAKNGGPALLTLEGHGDWVYSASFDRDGARIVMACQDGKARVFDAEKGGDAMLTLEGHGGEVLSASFNRDGARIVMTCRDGIARVFDAENGGDALLTLEGHGDWVRSASFNRDGSRIVTACRDGKARVFDAESGGPALLTLEGHGGWVNSASFNRDGSRIVTACQDGKVRIFDSRPIETILKARTAARTGKADGPADDNQPGTDADGHAQTYVHGMWAKGMSDEQIRQAAKDDPDLDPDRREAVERFLNKSSKGSKQ